MQNYVHKHAFLYIFHFNTFLSYFPSSFLHICTAWAIFSLIISSISISAGQNRLEAVWGEPKKKEIQGHELRMVALVTHYECSVVGSHSPALPWTHHPQIFHDHGKHFGQWNLSRVDKTLPKWSIIFCPKSWDADVMTETGVAILYQS